MLPAHLAENIRKQVLFYLQSTFDFRDREVDKAFERFLCDPENGLFKGPWVQLRRPYRPADKNETVPFDFPVPFHPFKHQNRSWRRLTSKEQQPKPTIVTTGTGSGKTECFLFPILDHCLRAKKEGQKGIKAIVLYPMNALAADQEKRFAKVIWRTPDLKAAGIRVGNYTGRYDPSDPGASAQSGERAMGETHGISHHETQQENPPDILLTNYKMLDYLLLRPQDQRLWQFNAPGVLRYLVLDELHTYDGAQGADVACLIRRLKERLDIPKGELCVVGTSATLDDRDALKNSDKGKGDGSADAQETGSDRLARFASTLFEEDIPAEAVIGEDRLTVEEIISASPKPNVLPEPAGCMPKDEEDVLVYTLRQSGLWSGPSYAGPVLPADHGFLDKDEKHLTEEQKAIVTALQKWELALGSWLKNSELFKYLLDIFEKVEASKTGPLTWTDMVERLSREDFGFKEYPKHDDRSLICVSFFALVAHAKEKRSGQPFPLVPTQVQLWIRELRRLGRVVDDKPVFTWLDEPSREFPSLPTYHCSECGESGWIALHDPSKDSAIGANGVSGFLLDGDPTKIYRAWFGFKGVRNPHLVVLSPLTEADIQAARKEGTQGTLAFEDLYLCSKSLVVRGGDGPCPLTNDPKRFRIKVNRDKRKDDKRGIFVGEQGCANCGSKEGVFFIGSQAATLSSVAIDEMFGSVLNCDPKLLAFTDSVQDASHRAGFFSARTYQFTFRTALQHVVDDAGQAGISLADVGKALLEWWSSPRAGWPGHIREAMASLMPPDLQGYDDFLEYRNQNGNGNGKPPKELLADIEARLRWEATSEFGLMHTHGRTMESAGSSCVAWDSKRIDSTITKLREQFPKLDVTLQQLTDESLRLWIYGFLHRHRLRGALDHPYLDAFAKANFWGKYPFGKVVPGRETYPSAGHYKPHLIVTHSQRGHDHVLAPTKGSRPPWHLIWARRALQKPNASDTALLDLIRALLNAGKDSGLFRQIHQDGDKQFFVISAHAARLTSDRVHLMCSQSERSLVRPAEEAKLWLNAPSVEYYADEGIYRGSDYTQRQLYYQDRYRKGALRRVVANEHTGLLGTEERETLEKNFSLSKHTDDPNVLTCTSTLEMGIDIGDLSSTMLCSIPPNTASYLQRIGRAGRATGTALIVSIVNQRPHDLFFYGRPSEMLRGRVDPPGCWLDASAVLVRQYLAYCFDSGTKEKHLTDLPKSAKALWEDLEKQNGQLPRLMDWVAKEETTLRSRFLKRLQLNVQADTRDRFTKETETQLLRNRIHQAANEFDRMRRDLENARKRLKEQLEKLRPEELETKREIEQELKILQARLTSLGRTTALEVLTDSGMLPNYAFPERGVRFYGAIYNKHRSSAKEHKPVEVSRPAGVALRELAPANHFYTHSRRFDIQQIAIGNPQQPLVEQWAVCGECGHMRPAEELNRPGAEPACPQCGHGHTSSSQLDQGQQRWFVEFSRSQAMSYMEHYESLSSDRTDERDREYYQVLQSFDLTKEAPSGAVGEEGLPFGIEYRASVVLRDVNVGYLDEPTAVPFGPDRAAPEAGFRICKDCGIALSPGQSPEDADHRRSCAARRRFEAALQKGNKTNPFKWESIYLYRKLQSEAIRLLLPIADDQDVDTLSACLHLGLRLRFEGNPAHLIVSPQIMPDPATGMRRYYLVLLDAVPGGTGYLKTLYQEKDLQQRDGEGIMQVMRLAKKALETCACRQLKQDPQHQDTDGCYRCIRTYHLQFRSEMISRERGIALLGKLIAAGEKRVPQKDLAAIKPHSLFGSMLEKKFVDSLKDYVGKQNGTWEQTIIKGNQGFRFSFKGTDRLWELELQPTLGLAQGANVQSQPDFLLRTDDEQVKPVAIFTDGHEFHCHPHNRLADDMNKRRSIIQSGNYHVWNVSWEDLTAENADHLMVCHAPVVQNMQKYAGAARRQGKTVPDARRIVCNGMTQLCAFIETPHAAGWGQLATFAAFWPLQMLAGQRAVPQTKLSQALNVWRTGAGLPEVAAVDEGEWVHNPKAALNQDFVTYISVDDAVSNRQSQTIILGRLGDGETEVSGSDYVERWRRFLACLNLFQFSGNFSFWTSREIHEGTAPDIPLEAAQELPVEWTEILAQTTAAIRPYVEELARAGLPSTRGLPVVEHFNDAIDDDVFAELAWPQCVPPIAVLVGAQTDFTHQWQKLGWKVFTAGELQTCGIVDLVDRILGRQSGASSDNQSTNLPEHLRENNRRRAALIFKRRSHSLTADEQSELTELQSLFEHYLSGWDDRLLAEIRRMEAAAHSLKGGTVE